MAEADAGSTDASQTADRVPRAVYHFLDRGDTRDARDRITAFQKGGDNTVNPMENRRGDRFAYDAEGQLTEGQYEALDPGGAISDNQRYDYFIYDALGNRKAWNCLGSHWTGFWRRDNGLNQYSSWTPSIIYHDDNSKNAISPKFIRIPKRRRVTLLTNSRETSTKRRSMTANLRTS